MVCTEAEGNICQQLGDRETNYLCKFTILINKIAMNYVITINYIQGVWQPRVARPLFLSYGGGKKGSGTSNSKFLVSLPLELGWPMISDNHNLRCRPHRVYSRLLGVVDTFRSCSCHQSSPTPVRVEVWTEIYCSMYRYQTLFPVPILKKKAVWLRETRGLGITMRLEQGQQK